MRALRLQSDFSQWKLFAERKANAAFLEFSEKVFIRDNYCCQFCGFRAYDFQEVININGNYRDNRLANMITACCFCMQCHFLEAVGLGDFGGGTLIYLPEIAQANLNAFCHVLFCAISNDTAYRGAAEALLRNLKFRSQWVEQEFGEGCSDPGQFGQLIAQKELANTELFNNMLAKVRLLPSIARFKTQIEHWASSAVYELANL